MVEGFVESERDASRRTRQLYCAMQRRERRTLYHRGLMFLCFSTRIIAFQLFPTRRLFPVSSNTLSKRLPEKKTKQIKLRKSKHTHKKRQRST